MNLFLEVRQRTAWLLRLGQNIHRATGGLLAATIAALLASQLALLLAMLLPLKAILLAASDGVPWYLASFVSEDTKDLFIIALALGALLVYGAHLLSEQIIAAQLPSGAARVLEQSRKLSLFRDEHALVRGYYLRFCRIIASMILFVFAAALGLLIEPFLFIAMLGLIVAEFLFCAHILRGGGALSQKLVSAYDEERSRFLSTLTNINFLIGFVLLFAHFLTSESRNAIMAIVAFLLLRQMTNRLRLAILDFGTLSADRHRINPLFHTDVRYVPPTDVRQETFLRSMHPDQRCLWIPEALADVTGETVPAVIESRWNDTSNLGITAFDIRVEESGRQAGKDSRRHYDYFLHCFSNAQIQQAEHVAKLFDNTALPPIAPHYLGRTTIADFAVLVFRGLPASIPSKAAFAHGQAGLIRACEQTVLAADLLDDYLRTHRTLAQRLDTTLIAHLRAAVVSPRDEAVVHRLERALPDVLTHVAALPAALENPDLARTFCRIDDNGCILAWSWHRWRVDLLNARTLENQKDRSLATQRANRIDDTMLEGENGRRILASRLSDLETSLRRGQIAHGLRHAADICQLWNRINVHYEKTPRKHALS